MMLMHLTIAFRLLKEYINTNIHLGKKLMASNLHNLSFIFLYCHWTIDIVALGVGGRGITKNLYDGHVTRPVENSYEVPLFPPFLSQT